MTDCINPRFKKMLHHYELGLLPENERRDLEIHLLECDYCFNKVQEFDPAARNIRFNPKIRELFKSLEDKPTADVKETQLKEAYTLTRRKKRVKIVTSLAAALVVLIILILKPWHIEISPTKEAIARQNRIAVMYFENLSGQEGGERMGTIATNLLIADLSLSEYVRVLSSQRLNDIIKLIGARDVDGIDMRMATRIAEQADARWLILGNILQVEPTIIITAQLIDIKTGDVTGSIEISGEENENIFSIVDRLTVEIKIRLNLPIDAIREPDRMVADVTTHSEEAYRYFLEAIQYMEKWDRPMAVESFQKALEYDSTFAMAYYYLSYLTKMSLIERAFRYSENISEKERMYIKARKYELEERDDLAISELEKIIEKYPEEKEAIVNLVHLRKYRYEYNEAIKLLNRALELDPLYSHAYNLLAELYDYTREFTKAVWAANKYIELEPDSATGYVTRGMIYANNGLLDQAIASYEKALEIMPQFHSVYFTLSSLYLYKKESWKVDSIAQSMFDSDDLFVRSAGWMELASIDLYQGKFKSALEILSKGLEEDTGLVISERSVFGQLSKHSIKRTIYQEQGDFESAFKEVARQRELLECCIPGQELSYLNQYARLLAMSGRYKEAYKIADSIKILSINREQKEEPYWSTIGSIALIKGDPAKAVEYLGKITKPHFDFFHYLRLARAYTQIGRTAEAIEIFENQLMNYSFERSTDGIQAIKVHYYAGQAYERAGLEKQAARQYEIFLDYWKDADPDLETFIDANQRLARLKN